MTTGNKVYFDTSIFIYALENDNEKAKKVISEAVRSSLAGTSMLTIMEYCAGCYRHSRPETATKFLAFLEEYRFDLRPLGKDVMLKAAQIRADYPALKQMDCLQLASAKAAGAGIFWTNDRQLSQFRDPQLAVLQLEP